MLTQAELEEEMVVGGRNRMLSMIDRNEAGGGAANNPYASAVMRRFVKPIADSIEADVTVPKPGRNKAHVTLLRGCDPMGVAYITVRGILNYVMGDTSKAHSLMTEIGKQVFSEMYMACFETASPALYHTVIRDIERRNSKGQDYRYNTMRSQAKKHGIELPSWGTGSRMYVGAYLVGLAEQHGMVEVRKDRVKRGDRAEYELSVVLSPDILDLVTSIKGSIIEACPMFFPCVEQPRDWADIYSGGWHTDHMIRQSPSCVPVNKQFRELLRGGDWTIPLAAINTLQSVRWQVNRQLLGTVRELSAFYDNGEIVGSRVRDRPDRPSNVPEDAKKEDMTSEQREAFVKWRRKSAEWYTYIKMRAVRQLRFAQSVRIADKFSEYPAIYFCYFADFRGRMYAQTTGISPQGSDLQKALLRFADGKPLATPEAEMWFKINGANKYGYDKASLSDRARWVDDRHDLIMAAAADPLSNVHLWEGADCPLQYLAWCFEYRRWKDNPEVFRSHLPIGMDGSCNGLQNFSAMLRDSVGGKATNLLPGPIPNDIYQDVASLTVRLLQSWKPSEHGEDEKASSREQRYVAYHAKWLAHGISRSLVKRSVMTKPYGSTRFSCADFIVADYLKTGAAPEFTKEEYAEAARFLSAFVWEAISKVVVKADEAMEWLQRASSQIMRDGHEVIVWKAPSGFPVIQEYEKIETMRIVTRLAGTTWLRSGAPTGQADRNRHRNGIAPNLVHSCDASHMARVAVAGGREGLSLAMIHDDFGCHAADAPALYRIIREEFVDMYENHNPLADLAEHYGLPSPPSMGNLDIRQVLDSPYFFS